MLTPAQISARMEGSLRQVEPGRLEALLPSPCVQNHAAFLHTHQGELSCCWFGGSLEGRSDISIYRSILNAHTSVWSQPLQLSNDPERSEQNPVLFTPPDGRTRLFHTAQPGGNQDECTVCSRQPLHPPYEPDTVPLRAGTFIRSPVFMREDNTWLLPLFRCASRPGYRWNGSHDTAALALSKDAGRSWREIEVPDSQGCVHMTIVAVANTRLAAFFRRRQADYVYRSESLDGGESWCSPVATDVPNNNSSIAVISLMDGRVAMVCNPVNREMTSDRRESLYDELGEDDDRAPAEGGCDPVWGVPRAPLSLCFSTDGGHRFDHRIIVENSPGHCLSNNSEDGRNFELSYPSLLQRNNGDLELAYTYFRRAIKHTRLTSEWQHW